MWGCVDVLWTICRRVQTHLNVLSTFYYIYSNASYSHQKPVFHTQDLDVLKYKLDHLQGIPLAGYHWF